MIATHNEKAEAGKLLHPILDLNSETKRSRTTKTKTQLLPHKVISHHPKAGLNLLVDASGYLFSVLGKIKQMKICRQLGKLHKELVQEINWFQEAIEQHGYHTEYSMVCRYLICATFDDIILNTTWGGQGRWENYSLLAAFNTNHLQHETFFQILERALKEPNRYIDMMEFIYICLSLGYKGPYRSTEHSQYQLEQIIHNLYKHIESYRGGFSKVLSPIPIKPIKSTKKILNKGQSPLFILFVALCIVLSIFVSFGYLMDVIANETFKDIKSIQPAPISNSIR